MFEGEVIICDEDGQMQAYGREDETLQRGDLRIVYDGYGLSRRPPAGTAIIVQEMGDDLVVVGTEYDYRPDLESGETRVWAGSSGDSYLQMIPDSMERLVSQYGHYLKLESDKAALYSTQSAGCEFDQDALVTSGRNSALVGVTTRIGSEAASNPLVKGTELSNALAQYCSAIAQAKTDFDSCINGGGDMNSCGPTWVADVANATSTLFTALSGILSIKNYLDK
jgi:hypothetical protein